MVEQYTITNDPTLIEQELNSRTPRLAIMVNLISWDFENPRVTIQLPGVPGERLIIVQDIADLYAIQ